MTDRTILLAGVAVPWRSALTGALLSLILGVGLARGLAAEHASSAQPAAAHALGENPLAPPRERLSSLPLIAQAPVSSALGAADPAYRIRAASGGFQAFSPGQRLSVGFERSHVLIGSGAAHLALSLRAVGYGSLLEPVGEVVPRLQGARVLYARAGLSEWYANGPLGLEQGFSVTRPPAAPGAGALTISMGLSGDAHAALGAGGRSIVLASSSGGPTLRYGDLAAVDARGRVLHSWLALDGANILLRVDARGARYPLRIDPLVQQAELTGGGEQGSGLLGFSVALSADGGTALVGAPEDGGNIGAAWVFTRSGYTWTQQTEITGGEVVAANASEQCADETQAELEGCGFGHSVALSANGNTALIGGPRANDAAGDARVFVRTGSSWSEQATLKGVNETSQGRFGKSVALSADGNTALIGAPVGRGAAWVFTRSGPAGSEKWSNEGMKLTGGEHESGEGHFGVSVALAGNGTTALVGAPTDTGGTDKEALGAAWVFTRPEGSEDWSSEGQRLTGGARESGEGRFGFSVSLSNDGATALVGARADSNHAGAAWVFTRSGSELMQQGPKLTAGGASGETAFGYSVAVSGDGDTALIGGPRQPGSVGMAWVFRRSGSEWGEDEQLMPREESGDGRFGSSVALSANGEKALVGAPSNNNAIGAAWVFGTGPGVEGVSPDEGLPAGGTTVTISGVNFDEATAVSFGLVPATSFTINSATSITAVSPPGLAFPPARHSVDVRVTTPAGESSIGVGDRFTYASPPEVKAISPVAGPVSGGTAVTISGSGFEEPASQVTSVLFGSKEAKSFTVNSNTSITAEAPEGPTAEPGSVEVRVIAPAGESPISPKGMFTYVSPPTVRKLSPNEGLIAGGAEVKISGSGFKESGSGEATSVQFGSQPAKSFTVHSSTSITAVAPAQAAGSVHVTVTNLGGTSATSANDLFTFLLPALGSTTGLGAGSIGIGSALGFGPIASPNCGVSLFSRAVTVQSHSRAAVKLISPNACGGKLTLKVKVRVNTKGAKTRFKAKTIGTVGFSVLAGKAKVVLLKLSAAGRALLAAHHGRLSAKLVILGVSPPPARTASVIVHLALPGSHSKPAPKK
jgi:IPT/TIG domain/FG-GAP repeat